MPDAPEYVLDLEGDGDFDQTKAEDIACVVWDTNGEYCDVRFRVSLAGKHVELYTFVQADYDEWKASQGKN